MMPPPSLSFLSLAVAYINLLLIPQNVHPFSFKQDVYVSCSHTTVYLANRIGTLPYTPAAVTPPSDLNNLHKEGSDQYAPSCDFYSIDNYHMKV
jgi:hypothetical protein